MSRYQRPDLYDNAYAYDNVYGHAVALLVRHRPQRLDGIHLDVGCGFGRIAEAIRDELGLSYVGCDAEEAGLASLRARGFEARTVQLSGEAATGAALREIVGKRRLASISILDTLEHLDDPAATCRALRSLAHEHDAFVLISVPNVAHRDVGFRLAFGRWDYTESGLLDHTHRTLFSDAVLRRMLAHCGLHIVDENDKQLVRSDQHFPPEHPALARGTLLHSLLQDLRQGADRFGETNQFVRLCLPGPPEAAPAFIGSASEADRPFLSIITRTQGTRPHSLAEVFTALAGQTDTDFEVLVIGHKLTLERQLLVERVIEDNPAWLRSKTRLVRVETGNRTHPINVGFAEARGSYIAVLDDDDLPFADWVETFAKLADASPGALLRAVAVRQNVEHVNVGKQPGIRATGKLERVFPPKFDFLEHLRINRSPNMSVAFPRGVFHDLRIAFDESLTTTEDWDYIMRAAGLVGVASDPGITAIYRWWVDADSSRTEHDQQEWHRNYYRIQQKMDLALPLFPPGTTARVRHLLDVQDQHIELVPRYEALNAREKALAEERMLLIERLDALRIVSLIYNSISWKITAPIRWLGRLLGRPASDPDMIWHLSTPELRELAARLRASSSWRLTRALRGARLAVAGLDRRGE
ncbi:MAG TPA: methyltransferase domain-containing protein [Acetobacteraceae bacterium]|nr:methyltransferase domain-containing protein [Acetobacteraceae bacterium]